MSFIKIDPPDYSDGMTKQAFKESTDINKILQKAQKVGSLSHLVRHGARYGDFSDVPDLLTAYERVNNGKEIFNDLPSSVKREFGNDMFKFFAFVNDPANKDRLRDVLPELAKPGMQLPDVRRSGASQAHPSVASAPSEPSSPASPPSAPAASGAATASSTT